MDDTMIYELMLERENAQLEKENALLRRVIERLAKQAGMKPDEFVQSVMATEESEGE